MGKMEKKIKAAFFGVKPDDWPNNANLSIYCRESSPPGYMIKMALMFLCGHRLPRGSDKSEWEICLSYKGKKWIITDWKRYEWKIYGPPDSSNDAKELQAKFRAVTKILDKAITATSDEELRNDNISIYNQFGRIDSLFYYFFDNAKNAMNRKVAKLKKSKDIGGMRSCFLNSQFNRGRDIEFNLLTSTIYFFALTELVFDSCFALCDRKGMRFSEFRHMEWGERFKFFISPAEDRTIESLYVNLLDIRTYYRNIPVHASPTYLFMLKGFGLIPSSYERMADPHISHKLVYEENEQKRIFNTFEDTIALLKSHPTTQFGYLYARSGLPIHIAAAPVQELKQHMTSVEQFEEELVKRSEIQDQIDNMDI
jgi:hypothetical protein